MNSLKVCGLCYGVQLFISRRRFIRFQQLHERTSMGSCVKCVLQLYFFKYILYYQGNIQQLFSILLSKTFNKLPENIQKNTKLNFFLTIQIQRFKCSSNFQDSTSNMLHKLVYFNISISKYAFLYYFLFYEYIRQLTWVIYY